MHLVFTSYIHIFCINNFNPVSGINILKYDNIPVMAGFQIITIPFTLKTQLFIYLSTKNPLLDTLI